MQNKVLEINDISQFCKVEVTKYRVEWGDLCSFGYMLAKIPIFFQKYLVMSKKSSTFALAFGENRCFQLLKRLKLLKPAQSAYGGYSSAGRASDCGSECRGFEPH